MLLRTQFADPTPDVVTQHALRNPAPVSDRISVILSSTCRACATPERMRTQGISRGRLRLLPQLWPTTDQPQVFEAAKHKHEDQILSPTRNSHRHRRPCTTP